jgi:hypothetical protein
MKNVKLLVLSDIHLERTNEIKQKFLLSAINEKVEQTKNAGFEPVVVFAGDVHNSTKGYDFISKVNAQCVYIAGNHEFWDADYYETIDKLKAEAPANATFLHNDVISVGQYLILGTTLWTDVGQSLNKDLLNHAGSRMNDMVYITAKKWYEDKKNISKLHDNYGSMSLETKLTGKKWNALIEIEENKKGWDFLSHVDSIYQAIDKARSIKSRLKDDLNSTSEWWRITEEIADETKKKLDITQKGLTWDKFIKNLATVHKNYTIFEEEASDFLVDSVAKNILFQKIRHIEDLNKKDIVILSHHLPFYEEILVGSFMQDYHKVPVVPYNEIDHNLFLVRSGINYPGFNYMLRASKGDLDRKNDITHIVNYYNNGSYKLPQFLLKNTKLWIHGHEHHFRFCDYVKGIQILANPSGSALNLFDTESGEIKLNNYYVSRNKIKDHQAKIEQIKNTMVSQPSSFLTNSQLSDSVKLWALKHFDFKEYKSCLKKVAKAAEKILTISIEYVQAEEKENKPNFIEQIEEKMSIWYDSYNYNCEKINQMHEQLKLAYSVRVNEHFSFESYYTKSLFTNNNFHLWVMGNAEPPQKINQGTLGVFSAKHGFEARENIRIALKHIDKLEEFLASIDIEHVHQVTNEHKELFESLSKKAIPVYRLSKKIQEKWQAFNEKTFPEDNKSLDFTLDRDF